MVKASEDMNHITVKDSNIMSSEDGRIGEKSPESLKVKVLTKVSGKCSALEIEEMAGGHQDENYKGGKEEKAKLVKIRKG